MTRRRTTTTLALTLAAGACAALAAAPSTATTPSSGATQHATASHSTLKFGACPASAAAPRGVYCARLKVPLDYAHPHGRQITLTVSAIGDANAPRAMLVNPGGPGEPGVGTEQLVWSALPEKVSEQDTVYSFDPRGVGLSTPISCGDVQHVLPRPQLPFWPRTAADERKQLGYAKKIASDCTAHAKAMLPYLTVANEARDMDRIRIALGKKTIDYLGYSAGSQLGATYATLFPAHTGRMVLDSIVDPTNTNYQQNFQQDVAFQKRFEQMFAWAAKRNRLYHLGATRAAVEKTWKQVRVKLAAHPAGGVAGSAELDNLLIGAAYTTVEWDGVFGLVADYRKGDSRSLLSAVRQASVDPVDVGLLAYTCNTGGWPSRWARWHDDTVRAHRSAPLVAWLNTWGSAPCHYWPTHSAKAVRIGSVKVPPILLLQGRDDAATPLVGAQRMRKALPNSRLIVHGGGDHAAYLIDDDPCLQGKATSYWLTGRLPKDGTCPAPA